MSANTITEMMLQAFLRFFIPGVVFIVFTLLLPSYFLVYLFQGVSQIYTVGFLTETLKFIEKPVLFILLSISVGILLDLSRFHSFWTKMIYRHNSKGSWFALKIAIVDAAGIEIDDNNHKEYKKKVIELAYQIHSVFVKIKYPEIDQKIENSRTYPDILSMSLSSAIAGIVLSVLSLGIKMLTYPENMDFVLLGVVIAIFCVVFFVGKERVRSEFWKIDQLTKSLIRDAFSKSSDEDEKNEKDFFEILEKRGLVEKGDGRWKIKKDSDLDR